MKKIEPQRFEFVLYINKAKKEAENKIKVAQGLEPNRIPIICQRYFSIRDYNEEVLDSMELKELMDELVGLNNDGVAGNMGVIPNFLKVKSRDYLWSMYNPHYKQLEEDIQHRDIWAKDDTFTFELKVDKNVVADGVFAGNYFPPKVRYAVNIKEIIPTIISKIRDSFSLDKYEDEYESYDLNYLTELREELFTLND